MRTRTEKLDLCKICEKMFLKTSDINVCPVCAPQKYSPEFATQSENHPMPLTKNEESIKKNTNRQKDRKWSKKFDRCVKCGRNDVSHSGRGLCLYCYQQETEKKHRGKQREKKGLAIEKLNSEYLFEEYINKKRSLGDIAKENSCSRQYVYKRMKELNIPFRSLTEARKLAYDRNKVSYTITDEDGKERLVIPGSIQINDNFFSSWSNEMAYVLGIIVTDGSINPGRKRDPSQKTTTTSPRLSISQKEPELLNKVSKLMNCDMKLRHKKQRGIAGEIYLFDICSEKIYDDLINFGLSPNKSKTIDFPNMPKEFVRHFIRGCWDGDGSVFSVQSHLEASYTSGSIKFIERLVQELNKVGISRSKLSHRIEKDGRRVPLPITEEMLSDYPDGKFPLVIYKYKRADAYYVKVRGKENVKRLFHYFYDGVDESMYLSRKYEGFVKGLKLEGKGEKEQLTLDLDS